MPKTDEERLEKCAGRLLGKMRRTSRRWPVLPRGSKVALGVSGGLDSLAMAYLVTEFNRTLKTKIGVMAVHVRRDARGETTGLDPRISSWLEERNVEVVEVPPRLDAGNGDALDCFACSCARWRTLLETVDGLGVDLVALGHHADDVVETWLLALFYTGTAELIPPVRPYFDGSVTVVRPLYELRRKELRRVVRLARLPEAMGGCTREEEARREKVRTALASFGKDQDLVRRQLYRAIVRQIDSEVDTG